MTTPASTVNAGLYAEHVAGLQARYEHAAARFDLDAVVIGSGNVLYHFLDDQPYRYVANPLFRQWIPLLEHPGSAIIFKPGCRPALIVHQPLDFWHRPPPLPDEAVTSRFELRIIRNPSELPDLLPPTLGTRMALLGRPEQWEGTALEALRNPPPLLDYLHYHRARKSRWEIACLRAAATIAAAGHRAAEAAFHDGGSEFDILLAFLGGCRQTEEDLPYGLIVALDEHGAALHYQHRDRTRPPAGRGLSLLIDAGCSHLGYASDITRSHARHDGEFADMVADMTTLQREICNAVRPGVPFADLHRFAHQGIARLLRQWDIVRMAPEDMVGSGITGRFLPHGLGHFLGLQVHDVGGHLADDSGRELAPPADFPKLRLRRTLEPGQVVTIEPGVYFIDSLLDELRSGPHAEQIDWGGIARLRRYGGIRIEDDLLITADGHENLTRQLPAS